MNEPVTLLLLQHLFPGWVIARDERGIWRADGRRLILSGDLGGLLDMIAAADPDAARRAARMLTESG